MLGAQNIMKKYYLFLLLLILIITTLSACHKAKDVNEIPLTSKYPIAKYPEKVGEWPALAKSGAGYFYDEVLEYRVWCHPENGAPDIDNGNDYYRAFPTYEQALSFTKETTGAEEPLVLVRQWEHVNEPEPGIFEHIKGERIAEWQVEWLQRGFRKPDDIEKFIKENSAPKGT